MFFIEDVKKGAEPYIEMAEHILEFYQKEFNLFEIWDIGFTVKMQNWLNNEVRIEIVSQPLPIGALGVWKYASKGVTFIINGSVLKDRNECYFRSRFCSYSRTSELSNEENIARIGESDIRMKYNISTKEAVAVTDGILRGIFDDIDRYMSKDNYETISPLLREILPYEEKGALPSADMEKLVPLLEALHTHLVLISKDKHIEEYLKRGLLETNDNILAVLRDYNYLLKHSE